MTEASSGQLVCSSQRDWLSSAEIGSGIVPVDLAQTQFGDDFRHELAGTGGDTEKTRQVGLEATKNLSLSPEKHPFLETGGAKASPPLLVPIPADDDVTVVVRAWPTLPHPIKVAILAMLATIPSP